MVKIWMADTEPNDRLDLYTRANVGEVFPNVITPLTASLIGEPISDGQVAIFVESGVLRPDEVLGKSIASGVFGGYLYLNAAAMRLFGVRMPGMSVEDIDEQVMGNLAGVPPYAPAKGDRNAAASWRIIRYSTKMLLKPDLGFLDEGRRSAERWLASQPDLDSGADGELVDWIEEFPTRQGASMKRLAQAVMIAGAPRGILDQLLEGAAPGLGNRIVAGTGDVDSAQLAGRLWSLGRMVQADAELTAQFDAGLDDIAARTHDTVLHPAVESFLADHGHRGNDEYELATPAWAMDSLPVYAAIERLRHAPEHRAPELAQQRLAADADRALDEALGFVRFPLRPMVRRAARVARLGAIARERGKDILVLENLGARRVLHELARRAAERGGPTDLRHAFFVTADELRDFVARPGDFAQLIAERLELADYLSERLPPDWFVGQISEPSTWPLRADVAPPPPTHGSVVQGIGVSGGTATGPARVIVNPADPRGLEPGEVLVCAITDPSWTPLFLAASGVVCDTGAVQSHASIVARELGIPAVMSVPGITGIADGTMLIVDGDAGTVTIEG